MKVVALISGGKDSCFNMVLCQHYGHEIVALANLLPTQAEVDDLDSYMYQTVGHQVVAAYASCMGLPLYRRNIIGASRDQNLVYEDTDGDEVEDLAALLAYVKIQMPEVDAVSSGAIASDYQRTRVERVCSRLGLVSLAYLWHQPQDPLLQRMINAQIEAILVKVAAAGLHPRRHLGASLAAVHPHLRSLRSTYGCNVCGEGGEYETLTLDCPLFTQGRILLDAWDTVTVSNDSMAPVALLHPKTFHVEPKKFQSLSSLPNEATPASKEPVIVQVPDDFLAPASGQNMLSEGNSGTSGDQGKAPCDVRTIRSLGTACVSLTAEVSGSSELYATTAESTTQALTSALQAISRELSNLNLTWQDALFVHLYVPAMAHFAAANAAYSNFFPPINPPSRATVQLALNPSIALVAEVLLRRSTDSSSSPLADGSDATPSSYFRPNLHEKKVLHVQSISEWAPSCIGPYSQAVSHQGLVFFAGQIPLDPPTMAVATSDPAAATARSLRSCQAVAIAMQTDLRYGSLWWTVYCSAAAGGTGRKAAGTTLQAFLRNTLTDDQHLSSLSEKSPTSRLLENKVAARDINNSDEEEEEEEEEFVDSYLLPPLMHRHWEPLVTYIEMPELPRGVVVEVQPVAWSHHGTAQEESFSSSSSDSSNNNDTSPTSGSFNAVESAREGPRWIAMMDVREELVEIPAGRAELHLLCSPGTIFRGSAFVISAANEVDTGICEVAGVATQALRQKMEAGLLGTADVVAVKVYVPMRESSSSGGGAGADFLDGVRKKVETILEVESIVVVVPVLRVGSDPSASALLGIEVFARK